jgi:ABC-type transport system involved in Fe-S cluster assembly fused permease/ATPase subunit
MKEWFPERPAGMGIVCSVIPLASVSGPAFLAVVIVAAALFLWWLLRSDSRDDEAAAEQDAAQQAERDRLSAP